MAVIIGVAVTSILRHSVLVAWTRMHSFAANAVVVFVIAAYIGAVWTNRIKPLFFDVPLDGPPRVNRPWVVTYSQKQMPQFLGFVENLQKKLQAQQAHGVVLNTCWLGGLFTEVRSHSLSHLLMTCYLCRAH